VEKVTLSVLKADVGGFLGHTGMHEDVLRRARELANKAVSRSLLLDAWVGAVGDDLELVVTHDRGSDSKDVHKFGWEVFAACAEVAERLKLHSPGQDLLSETFGGHLAGAGPGFAEITFRERPSEPVIIFMADKCDLGAWNLPLYRMFADPFNTAGLIIDPSMHEGFGFELLDIVEYKAITLQCPGDIYDLIMFLGSRGRFYVNKVIRRVDGTVAAQASAPRPPGSGESAGIDDPVLIVRCETGLPSVGEATEAFAFPHLVTGWLRNTHQGPLMPVPFKDARCVRFDGPPRVVAAGFQLNAGKLSGPVDLFDDPAFEGPRRRAMEVAEYLRRHGPFEPHRVPHDQMANTPFPPMLARLESRFVKVDAEASGKGVKGAKKRVPTNADGTE
jgi:fructose 1,6-bisphosphate aldolase/phosphatase